MRLLELSLPTAAANLALDEALLEQACAETPGDNVLRLWEFSQPVVVMGRGTRRAKEVHDDACRALGVEVLRRVSGGASIVAGPGCLMFSVVLSRSGRGEFDDLDQVHHYVRDRMLTAIRPLEPTVCAAGISDLATVDEDSTKKISGNSLRIRREAVLYHGTLLYDFDLRLIDKCLRTPPREPDYRGGRSHADFVANLPVTRDQLQTGLREAWEATTPCERWPRDAVPRLVKLRYGTREWNT